MCQKMNEEWQPFKQDIDNVIPLGATRKDTRGPSLESHCNQVVTRAKRKDDPQKNEDDSLHFFQSYSYGDVQKMQQEDSDLKYIQRWFEDGKRPDRDKVASYSPAVRYYWLQWENLTRQNGVIYMKWFNNKGKVDHLVLLVPRVLHS